MEERLMLKRGGGPSGAGGGAPKTASLLEGLVELESIKAVHDRNGAMLLAEQNKLMSWMRRNTTLGDDEIHQVLTGHATASFNAGHDIGWIEAMWKAKGLMAREKVWRWTAFVTTSALAAALWMLFGR